ncbi:MAG: hypothetical protein KF833_14605 [Verrucomicrobiae bacterium]|nr:hypothetical protein [Verrucomicrobiae bacterium]
MSSRTFTLGLSSLLLGSWLMQAQSYPPPEAWPPTVDPNRTVHFVVTDGGLDAPGAGWSPDLLILSGGDQVTSDITIGGFQGKKVDGNFLNVADPLYDTWAEEETIDILVQVYGDGALFNAAGEPRNFNFLTGILPNLAFPVGGQIPVEAGNRKWNWVLFRIPNGFRPDGTRYIGSIPDGAQGSFGFGGVNGGTIRFEGVPNLIVRVVAFGEMGAFGEPEDFLQFAPAEGCEPEPATNLAGIDIHADSSSNIQVLDSGDQTVVYEDNVGPAGDQRRAVRPEGMFLNFGITGNYLGLPCNDPRSVKVCVDFYDDPAFEGLEVQFGPEAYATDDATGIGFVPAERRHVMQGTGQWIRRSWVVPAVNLRGVNAEGLTAGPRFISENGQVAVSRFEIAVLRTGAHPLAGQDPLSDCHADPAICTDAYGSYAELDLALDIRDGLDVGSSGGDQNMIVDEAGPAEDRRMAVRPAFEDGSPGFNHNYLNFAILEEALGPSSQPPARLVICATYYDDPELVGVTFRPEVYQTERGGNLTLAFTPGNIVVTLEGTGTWRQAYWEIPDMKFQGVNQGPQAAARFVASGKVFISRLQYAVIRPCGPNAGENALEDCRPPDAVALSVGRTDQGAVRFAWPASATGLGLESAESVEGPWTPVAEVPTVEGNETVLIVTPSGTRFYRLATPAAQ